MIARRRYWLALTFVLLVVIVLSIEDIASLPLNEAASESVDASEIILGFFVAPIAQYFFLLLIAYAFSRFARPRVSNSVFETKLVYKIS
jgi:hypothetical protein